MKALTSRVAGAALGLALPWRAGAAGARLRRPGRRARRGIEAANVGVVAGIAVGALPGGPWGRWSAPAPAHYSATTTTARRRRSAALMRTWSKSEAERARLAHDLTQRSGSLARAQARGEQLDAALQRTDQVGLDVGFRTNDDGIAMQNMTPLLKLGALVAAMPQARVRIAGYADPRGSDAYNDELSLRRAQSVAAVLSSAGVPAERIAIEAHGKSESTSTAGDLDAYALDRRVTVRVELPGAGQVASRE